MTYFAVVGITLHVIVVLLLLWETAAFTLDRSCRTGCARCNYAVFRTCVLGHPALRALAPAEGAWAGPNAPSPQSSRSGSPVTAVLLSATHRHA